MQPFLNSLAEEAEVDGAGRTASPGLPDFLEDLREQVVFVTDTLGACVSHPFASKLLFHGFKEPHGLSVPSAYFPSSV